MYRYALALLIFLGFIVSANADIYKWIDPNGVVHYSDVPGSANAVQIQVPSEQSGNTNSPSGPPSPSASNPISSFSAGSGDSMPAASAPVNTSKPTPPPHLPYTSVKIIEPTPEYTYVNDESGEVIVKVQLVPQLQQGDMLQLILDGNAAGQPQATSNLKVENMDRGQHTVQVNVVDSSGQTVGSSNVVNFYMQRIAMMHHASLNTPSSSNPSSASAGQSNSYQANSNQPNTYQSGANPVNSGQVNSAGSTNQADASDNLASNPVSTA